MPVDLGSSLGDDARVGAAEYLSDRPGVNEPVPVPIAEFSHGFVLGRYVHGEMGRVVQQPKKHWAGIDGQAFQVGGSDPPQVVFAVGHQYI